MGRRRRSGSCWRDTARAATTDEVKQERIDGRIKFFTYAVRE
jgi:hypothetical protein